MFFLQENIISRKILAMFEFRKVPETEKYANRPVSFYAFAFSAV
jgi:hypothetical protein